MDTDVPANYIVRQRSEQAGLRKSLLRIYHLQREEFLPSAYALIVALVTFILILLMFTDFGGMPSPWSRSASSRSSSSHCSGC